MLFTHLIAASKSTGVKVMLPSFGDYHQSFPLLDGGFPMYPVQGKASKGVLAARFLVFHMARAVAAVATRAKWGGNRWVRVFRIQRGERLDLGEPALRKVLATTRLVILQGWLFRDPGSLKEHAGEIRRVLAPDPSIIQAASESVDEARAGGGAVVGIHIRQGDYRDHLGGRFFFPTDVYIRAMERIADLLPGEVRFLIASDTPQDRDRFSHLSCRWSDGDPLHDLFALAACDYLCGPPSSFSLWASFYGQTPLAMLVSADGDLTVDDFRVAPEIRDPAVADLY